MPTIKGKLGGFNKKQVDEHIRKIKNAQDVVLEDLSKKIEVCQWETEILKQELDSLIQKDLSLPDQELLEFAINKVDRVLRLMDQDVTIDVLAIEKVTQQKLIALENSIEELDKDIEKEKEIIEKEIVNNAEIAKGQEKVKKIHIDVIKNMGKVLPIADWLKNNREEQANPDEEFWGEELKSQPQKLDIQMTSDGLSLESHEIPDIDTKLSDPIANCIDKSYEIKVSSVVKKNNWENEEHKEVKDNGFHDYLNEVEVEQPEEEQEEVLEIEQEEIVQEAIGEVDKEDKENGDVEEDSPHIEVDNFYHDSPEVEEPGFSESMSDFWDVSFSWEENPISSVQEMAATEEVSSVKAPSQDLFKPSETLEAHSQTFPRSQSQADVRDEISAVRDKYIIGRVAGEDIVDAAGQVIIRKDEPITLNLMQLAQKEGKLADLIIHMVLPGQEE